MKYKIDLATLFLVGALPLAAIAAEPTQPPAAGQAAKDAATAPASKEEPPPLFRELDSKHDGYVTKDEAKRSAEVTARFKELDSDHDGRIAVVEYRKGMQAK